MGDLLPFGQASPSIGGALVPRSVQRQLEAVQQRGLFGRELLTELEGLMTEAAMGIGRQAALHDMIMDAAPLAADGLAALRADHAELARKIIRWGLS